MVDSALLLKKLKSKIVSEIKNNHLSENIISIYNYGSLSTGDFVSGFSDIDLFVIIPQYEFELRLKLEQRINTIFNKINQSFIEKYSTKSINNEIKIHNPTILSEDEFINHCTQFPVRVAYPIKNGIWKLLYGKKIHNEFNQSQLMTSTRIDFDLFANKWYSLFLQLDIREAHKYYLTAFRNMIIPRINIKILGS